MKNPFYVTTPIYYVNDSPHLGHAYTTIAADVLARFMRLSDRDTYFLTGTDEHGQKVDKAAKLAGITPQAFTDDVSQRFRALVKSPGSGNLLDVTNDDFIRTTEERHKKACQELWKRMEKSGAIYKDKYGGWYAVRDEAYYQEGELIEKNGKKVAPTGAEVEWVEEESYFFALDKYQDKLLKFYDAHPDFVVPASRYNEVKSFVKGGLKPLSISRTTFNWGVPVPDAPGHVMYVWVDALTNYLTALGFPEDTENFKKFWPQAVHIVGKDILRFHAVYWPAFLMAAELPCPKQIVAHGWWTIEGEKMSKSLGNVIAPKDLVESYGLEAVRYYMLRAMPFGNDGDFSASRVVEVVNADLANNIGNLAQRVLKMIGKNCGGVVPERREAALEGQESIAPAYAKAMEIYQFDAALQRMLLLASAANEYVASNAPWTLIKEGKQKEAETVLYNAAEAIRKVVILLQPFCPSASARILVQLGYAEAQAAKGIPFTELDNPLKPGTTLPEPAGVFPRLEVKKDAA